MRVRWTRRTLRALAGVADYIAQDNPAAAQRIVGRVEEAVARLADHPSIGQAGRVAGTRELILSGTPFIVPYRVRDGSLEILTVLHAARKWPEEFP
jgi:toxin ParE1/3/4